MKPPPSWRAVSLQAIVPDVAKGVRAAVATLVPFYLAGRLGQRELVWMALGGWFGTLADPGGRRSARAGTLAVFGALGTLVTALGELAAPSGVASAAGLALTAFAGALGRSLGGAGASAGPILPLVFAIAAARPGKVVAIDAASFAIGSVWAIVLSSIIWPVWTHAPVRRGVAAAFGALADYARALRELATAHVPAGDPRWLDVTRQKRRRVRGAIEEARAVALAIRGRRSGESAVGSGLRVLLGMIEAQFGVMVALGEVLEASSGHAPGDGTAIAALDRLAPRCEAFARSVLTRAPPPPDLEAVAGAAGVGQATSSAVETGPEGSTASPPSPGDPAVLAARLLEAARETGDLLAALDQAPPRPPAPAAALHERPATPDLWLALRSLQDALSPRSPVFHHGLRVAGAAAAASVVGRWISPQFPHWVTITTLAVLQPQAGATFVRVVERMVGTVLGCLVAVAISALVRDPLALVALMFPLSIAAVATRPRSYRLFTFFLTPVFVLLAARTPGDFRVAWDRALDALAGGAIALVAALGVLPSWEGEQLPETLASVVDSVARQVSAVFDAWQSPGPLAIAAASRARREAGIALNEAEAALERVLAEPRRPGPLAGPAMQILTYARRLSGALTALQATVLGRVPAPPATVPAYVLSALSAAAALARGRVTPALPAPPAITAADPFVAARLEDLRRYAALLATAGPVEHSEPPSRGGLPDG